MNIPILKFKITDYKERIIPKKLFRKAKTVIDEESYEIVLSYNIDEDRFYYEDENKLIPTKKDLSRSIIMIYNIYKRYEKFGLKDNFKISENNLDNFLKMFIICNNNESNLYFKKMLFGTQPVSIMEIDSILDELNIDDVNFTNYYYYQYPRINFR